MADMNLQSELNNIKNWKRTSKKKYDVYVCRPAIGSRVTNVLDGAKYTTDQNKQFVMSGTVGETWVIDFGKLCKTYNLLGGQPITEDVIKSRLKGQKMDWLHVETKADADINFAFHLDPTKYGNACKNFPVQTSWGDTLYANRTGIKHGVGDFLVCAAGPDGQPNLKDVWVVNGTVFPNTYDMRAFPGLMKNVQIDNKQTPVPKSISTAADKVKTADVTDDKDTGRARTEFQIVGRYMNGKEVTGYHLQSIKTGKSGRFTKAQVCFLIGREQITNCVAQITNNDVILRGKGMNLTDLPIINAKGELRNSDELGKVRRGTEAIEALNQFRIVGTLKSGRNTVGYMVQNAGCGTKRLSRADVIKLAKQGKIGNARVQQYQGRDLLRGVDCNLDQLPSEIMK